MTDALMQSIGLRALGWALVQFVWQGTIIAATTGVSLRVFKRGTARLRYGIACCGLLIMSAAPLATTISRAGDLRAAAIPQELSRASSAGESMPVVIDRASQGAAGSPLNGRPSGSLRQRLDAWSVIIVLLWLCGVVVLSCRLMASWFMVQRLKHASLTPVPETLRARVEFIAGTLAIGRSVRVLESALANVPMVIGALKPVLLLPVSACSGLSLSQLDTVIAHELAHIRRHDYLVNILQSSVETLLFYHPAIWWLSRQIRVEREHCCDDVALTFCDDPLVYMSALADLEELRAGEFALGMEAAGGSLVNRMRRLMGTSTVRAKHSSTWMVTAAVVTMLSLVLISDSVGAHKQLGLVDVGSIRGSVTLVDGPAGELGRLTRTPSSHPMPDAVVAELTGRVIDQWNRPIPSSLVVAFPEDGSKWRDARLLHRAVANQEGFYRIQGMVKGHYRLAALTSLPVSSWPKLDLLDRLRPLSTSIEVQDDQPRQVSLVQAPAPDLSAVGQHLSFDVASIKQSISSPTLMRLQIQPGGRLAITNAPVRAMIRNAYRLQDSQIVDGPEWLSSTRFDIVAKAEGNPTAEQMVVMLQTLLAERFRLVVHRETRQLPIYALVMARSDGRLGSDIRRGAYNCAAERSGPPPANPTAPDGSFNCGFRVAPGKMSGRGASMSALAASLSNWVGRIVIDRTGLSGDFDLDMTWTPDQMPQGIPPGAGPFPPIDPNGPAIFTAIQEQLGLKLESTRGPVDVLVIDHVEHPTED